MNNNGSKIESKGKGLFRLTNLNFSISTSLSGDKIKGESRKQQEPDQDDEFKEVALQVEHLEHFRPGQPTPVHRDKVE